ncbi:hypothetical protein BGZ57DRAFT_854150 [Hyaloscypha finlandica]|nr:hypothetical protein BGZ57DRAFT_854150 [Hyaloscypha finlandica]
MREFHEMNNRASELEAWLEGVLGDWQTAVPLTAITITLCLIWAAELENFWTGFGNPWGGKKRKIARVRHLMLNSRSRAHAMLDSRAEPGRNLLSPRFLNNRIEYERFRNDSWYRARAYNEKG